MREIIEAAMGKAGITQMDLANRIHKSRSATQRLIYGMQPMTPDDAMNLADAIECPTLTMVYCRQGCVIGKKYGFDLLNNVDLNPTAILAKYRQEEREAHEALDVMLGIVINKKGVADCTDIELSDLWHCALEMLDLEHVIETLKLRLWDFLNVEDLIAEHNKKCRQRGYVDPKKLELVLAG